MEPATHQPSRYRWSRAASLLTEARGIPQTAGLWFKLSAGRGPAVMSKALSLGLWQRTLAAVLDEGLSHREAAGALQGECRQRPPLTRPGVWPCGADARSSDIVAMDTPAAIQAPPSGRCSRRRARSYYTCRPIAPTSIGSRTCLPRSKPSFQRKPRAPPTRCGPS